MAWTYLTRRVTLHAVGTEWSTEADGSRGGVMAAADGVRR